MEEAAVRDHNQVNTKTLEHMLKKQIEAVWRTPGAAGRVPPMMIWGAPGTGKSTIIRELAEGYGVEFIDIRLSQREPVDIRGLPVPVDGRVEWLVSSDWPRSPDSRGIILFDELTAADRSMQVAAYELILDRRIGNLYQVPDGWYICAAGNRVCDRAVAATLSSALANRFLHVELEADAESWCGWALRHGVHPSVIGFIRFAPDKLLSQENENLERGWPSPRSWERASTMLTVFDGQPELMEHAVVGLVGVVGIQMLAVHHAAMEFADVRRLMLDPGLNVIVPERIDIKYAWCSAMVHHLWRGADAAEAEALLDGFYRISLKLSSDFATLAMIDAMKGTAAGDDFAERLYRHPGYQKWEKLHGGALRRAVRAAAASGADQ
jgi:hypothetical protein